MTSILINVMTFISADRFTYKRHSIGWIIYCRYFLSRVRLLSSCYKVHVQSDTWLRNP